MEDLHTITSYQCDFIKSIGEHLGNPEFVFVCLDKTRKENFNLFRIYTGHTNALLYWLCEQRQFRDVYWLTYTLCEKQELFNEFETLLTRMGDTRKMELRDGRGKLKLRDDADLSWSFQFIKFDEYDKNMRGFGRTNALIIVDTPKPLITDLFWLPHIANGSKFLWLWPLSLTENDSLIAKSCAFL